MTRLRAMLFHSIRWKWMTWQAFLLGGLVAAFGVTAARLHRTNRFHQIDAELEARAAEVASDVRTPPLEHRRPFPPEQRGDRPPPGEPRWDGPGGGPGERMPRMRPEHGGLLPPERTVTLAPQTLRLFDETETNDFYYAVWSTDATPLRVASNAPPDLSRPRRVSRSAGLHVRMRGMFREVYQFTEMRECVLVGRWIGEDLAAMHRFVGWLSLAGFGVLLLGLGSGWLLTNHAVRPIEHISAEADRISAGNLSEPITVSDRQDELGRLAAILNSTFARLEAAFTRQRQFTSDAAHELRTPISVIISEAQTALARPRDAEAYRETIGNCLDAGQQMRSLTQSLLSLARLDDNGDSSQRRPLDLAELTRRCVEQVRPLAGERGIDIEGDLHSVRVEADAEHMNQVVVNLLVNAIDYNHDRGKVEVRVAGSGAEAELSVTDTGIGIPAEDLPKVFDRFYRGDSARAHARERTGLGLAICRAIVQAHGGSITAASEAGQGTTLTVRLPRASLGPGVVPGREG